MDRGVSVAFTQSEASSLSRTVHKPMAEVSVANRPLATK